MATEKPVPLGERQGCVASVGHTTLKMPGVNSLGLRAKWGGHVDSLFRYPEIAPPTAGFCSCLLSAGQPTTKNERQFSTHGSHQTHFIMCASDRECQNCQRIPSDRTTTCMTGFNSSPCSHLCVPLRVGCVSTPP